MLLKIGGANDIVSALYGNTLDEEPAIPCGPVSPVGPVPDVNNSPPIKSSSQ